MSVERDAQAVAAALSRGDYEFLRSRFNEEMLTSPQVSANALAEVWESVVNQVGQYREAGEPQVITTAHVPISFERGKAELRISYDGEGRIAGLFLTPSW